MSENEAEKEVLEDAEELEDEEIEDDESPKGTEGDDKTDWEAKAKKLMGINKRLKTKLGKSQEPKPDPVEKKEEKTEKKGFDYAELAYIRSEGIVGDEKSLVEDWVKDTGKKIEDVIANPRFQAELKDFREAKASKEAIPSGSKRSASSSKDSVDYWIAKGELPPDTPGNRELRQKVVNAKIKAKTSGGAFDR